MNFILEATPRHCCIVKREAHRARLRKENVSRIRATPGKTFDVNKWCHIGWVSRVEKDRIDSVVTVLQRCSIFYTLRPFLTCLRRMPINVAQWRNFCVPEKSSGGTGRKWHNRFVTFVVKPEFSGVCHALCFTLYCLDLTLKTKWNVVFSLLLWHS